MQNSNPGSQTLKSQKSQEYSLISQHNIAEVLHDKVNSDDEDNNNFKLEIKVYEPEIEISKNNQNEAEENSLRQISKSTQAINLESSCNDPKYLDAHKIEFRPDFSPQSNDGDNQYTTKSLLNSNLDGWKETIE